MTYTKRTFHLLTLLWLGLGLSSATADPVQPPSGGLRAATAADLRPQLPVSGSNNEFWTYSLHLDGGLQLLVNFSRASFNGIQEAAGGADLTVMNFDGKTYHVARQYDADDVRFDASRNRLQVHPDIYAEGALPNAHRLYFETEKDDVAYEVELTFSNITPGVVWGDGIFKLGSERVGLFIHIPRANVQGTVRINGVEKQVRGTGYMDHTFMTTFAPRLVRRGYRYVSPQNGLEAGYVMIADGAYDRTPVGYGVAEQGGRLVLRKPTSVEATSTDRPEGFDVPTLLQVRYADGEVTLKRRYDRFRRSALAEAGGITKVLARKYIGGEVWYFRGQGTLNGTQRPMYFSYFIVE